MVAQAGKTATMSCVTSETTLVITDIMWVHGMQKEAVTEGAVLTSVVGANSGG